MAKHQKRISVPNSWQISKKSNKWITTTRPGPHHKEQSIPLGIVLRDMLGIVDNRAEAKRVLSEGKILVDGIVKKDLRFPIGLLDVISIPDAEVSYRVLLDRKGRLELHKLEDADVNKLCRINGKTVIKGGAIQLNLSDGSNVLGSNDYSTKDSIILSLPDKEVLKHIKYEVGNIAMIVGGRHTGEIGTIKEINTVRSSRNNTVSISGDYDFETIEDYVVVIGEDEPEIKLGGEAVE
ncbi:30S ribosomal protein S4e [Methanolobus zinderi]|uniref:Small ribosomal subunit protein eS4 n=1 Tax=Methanolobus zinderi TaxID=536044 RepID=A0A7D5INJ4_9EURY|nr:30S ribosomal protein S4e [Methanolobus zinderi]KXS41084.1 MAG: 30S ribosomal protein S4e [Methanolobus sp. T82-4]QLC49287.1 30S ribosomal protein S4e [Methanolobus zinderi]